MMDAHLVNIIVVVIKTPTLANLGCWSVYTSKKLGVPQVPRVLPILVMCTRSNPQKQNILSADNSFDQALVHPFGSLRAAGNLRHAHDYLRPIFSSVYFFLITVDHLLTLFRSPFV
jgi:hypothetical protein